MTDMDKYRSALQKLAEAMEQAEEHRFAAMIREQSDQEDRACVAFLVSNELWGGAGSIADQAGMKGRATRRGIEQVMIELGELQLKDGVTNPRTKVWTDVFKEWKSKGV
jgi:hypothetical protein